MTHHEQAIVTGFTLANDGTRAQLQEENRIARRAFRYDPQTALRATLRLREESLIALWFEELAQ